MFMQRVLLIGIIFTLISCQSENKEINRKQIVRDYYNELNLSNLFSASNYINDSIILSEFDFIQVNTKQDWFRQFKWDSVFLPNYKIIDITETDGRLVATISKECKRIRYCVSSFIS